jgi:mercuric ion transport protein
VLVLVGISGAWISNLAALEPYQPLFIALSAGQVCALPRIEFGYKLLFGLVVILSIVALGSPFIASWFY